MSWLPYFKIGAVMGFAAGVFWMILLSEIVHA